MPLNRYYLAPLFSLAAISSAHAATLAQDQFLIGTTPTAGEYVEDASLDGTGPTGGSLIGFSGNWNAANAASSFGNYSANASGLTYSGLSSSGGTAHYVRTQSGNGAKDATRNLSGTAGNVLYGSVLIRASDWTDNSLSFAIGAGSAIDINVANGVVSFENSGSIGSALAVDTTHLLVFKIDESAADGGVEDWSFWLNPTELGSEPVATATGVTSDNNLFNSTTSLGNFVVTANFNQNDTVMFDEFRLGDSWSDVAPIPEPSNAGMILGLGALGMMLGLRRR